MLPYFEFCINQIKINVPAYTFFSCVGAAIAMIIIYNRIGDIEGMTFKKFLFLIALMGFGVAFGSKALFVITLTPDIISNWSMGYAIKKIITAGFVFYGGLTGALVGIVIFSKIMHIRNLYIANVISPALPAFHAFGRLGCLFAGCCYGKKIEKGFYHLQSEPGVSRIPIQLIECIFLIFICILLFYIDSKKKEVSLIYIYLMLYAIGRFIIELFRDDTIRGIWLGLSTSQWIAIIYFIISVLYFCRVSKTNDH